MWSPTSRTLNRTVNDALPERVGFVGAMRPDAVLTALPTAAERKATGRRRRRGRVLPKPEALAADATTPWLPVEATLYGRACIMHAKSFLAQWYIAYDTRLLHVVVVRLDHGRMPLRVFFSSDPDLSPAEILESYAGRWSIEVCFRNLKQHLGFADSPARLRRAVERTAPFAGLLYTALVLWFVEHAAASAIALVPARSWYTHKTTLSFEDVLRAARFDLFRRVSDPATHSDNLHNDRWRHRFRARAQTLAAPTAP